MARKIEVTTFYQADEEILTMAVKYIDPGSTTEVNMLDLKEIAEDVVAAFGTASEAELSNAWWLHAVQVSQAANGTGAGEGPATWIETFNGDPGNGVEGGVADIYTVNVGLSGLNGAGKFVVGGYRISGLKTNRIDCNVIDSASITAITNLAAAVYPAVLSPVGGTYSRMVEHNPSGGPQEDVIAPTLEVSNRVGIRRNRIGNVTPYKISPAGP